MFALETKERKIILPIWHNVTHEQVLAFNPILGDRFAIPSTKTLDEIIFSIEGATWNAQKATELANPFRELIEEIRNEILERQVNDQLSNSYEGVELVKANAFLIFNRFEQLINENQDALNIQVQRRDTATLAVGYPSIIASGPLNANVEIGYLNKSVNRAAEDKLVISMFARDYNFPSVQWKRKERNHLIYNPSFTAKSEVIWILHGDTAKARRSSEQIAQQAVSSLLYFIRERVQGLDNYEGAYHPPYEM